MEGKKRYVAIVLFLLIGLTLFAFANPVEEQKGSKGNGSKDSEVTDKDTVDGTLGTGEQTQVQTQVQNQVVDTSYADALAAVVKAEGSLAELDVDTARDLINKVTNQNQKDELTERLDIVEEAIDAIELVETLEQMVEEATDRDGIEDSIDYRTDKEIIQLVDSLRNKAVQESLKDRLQILSRILDDNTAPEYEGVEDNEITNKDVSLTYSDTDEETGTENEVAVTVTLDGEEIDYAETFTKEGTYVVTLTDEAFNETTVTFTIDKTAPKFVDLKNGNHYEAVKAEVDDEKATILVKNVDTNETTEVANGTVLTEDATYYITATDAAGNETSIWVAIDKTAPTITGIDETKPTNKNEIVYVKDKFLTSVTIDGKEYTREDFEVGTNNENFSFQKKVTKEGTHTVVAKDKFGNTTTKTFVIDKTAPTAEITYSITELTNKNITVTLTADEEVEVINSGTWNPATGYAKVFKKAYSTNYTQTVTIRDKAGNETTLEVKIENIDKTAAKANYVAILSKGNNHNYAKNGDTIRFLVAFNEEIQIPSNYKDGSFVVEINGKEVHFARSQGTGYEYIAEYKIPTDETNLTEGELTFTIKGYTDLAGNVGESLTDAIHGTYNKVIYDRTAPVRKSADFYVSGLTQVEKTFYTQYGNKVVVNITTDEQLSTIPTFTLNNNGNSYPMEYAIYRGLNDKGYHLYQASFVVTEESGMTDGEITFTVSNIQDLAGNVRDDVTEPTNGRKVVLDNEAPKAKNVAILGGTLVKEDSYTRYANNGDIIYVNVHFYEKLAVKPIITLNDKVQTKIGTIKYDETSKVWIYSSSYKLTEGDGLANGEIQVKVSGYADHAGNVGTTLTNENMLLNSQKHVVIDRTNPTLTVKEESVGTEPYYSEISFKLYDNLKIDYFTVNGTKFDRSNAQWSDANYQNIKSALVEGENTIVLYDIAGNKTTKTFYMDWTKATINLAGTEGLNKNEMRVESGTEVTLDDVMATMTDNFDETTKIKPYKADLLISNVASENTYNYDFTNGFNTRHIGRYNIYYEYTDKAGNKSIATMLLVMTDTTPATITLPENGQAGRNNNEMHVESGTEVTLEDVLATVTDNVDETSKIAPYKVDLLISNVASENTYNYDFANGFDTRYVGRYNIYYTYTDKAGHITSKTMLLVMTDTTSPVVTANGANPTYVELQTGTYKELGATVTDNVDDTYQLTGPSYINHYTLDGTFTGRVSAVDPNTEGKYLLVYMATDSSDNVSNNQLLQSKIWVIVSDTTAPIITVSDGTIGTGPYKKLNLKMYDKFFITSVVINGTKLAHTGYYIDINDGDAYTFQQGTNTVVVTDKAGNVTTKTFEIDRNTHYVYTFADLKAAFAAGGKAKVMADIQAIETLTLSDAKELVLDMNGHKLTINDTTDPMMDIKRGAKITITGNGTFDLEDHKYASLMYPRGEVIIENGNFLRASGTNKNEYGSFFLGISGSGGAAKIRIYDGYFDGGYYVDGDEFNNSRTMLNGSWEQDIKIYGGTFVGQNPAYGDEGMAHTNPNSTSTYCQTIFFEGQTRTDTEIPSTYKVEKGILADGRPTYKVIYTPNN